MARRLWQRLIELVERHPQSLAEVRGAGLMLGLRCRESVTNADLITALRERGLLTVGAADNVIRLLPPLIINDGHIDEALGMLEDALAALEKDA